ncbi:phosphonate ABC transporter, permease protein PhnE [Natronosalvus halobius]|uniref:phosphonate ABC transporter, permease protein PhnE n=1 Tax=Natronosalvus halobius TaxID=2953746 RepID=UPI00209CAEF4|nr:phosphonate ABC transporter, permease protein PhnE [Natronosalvus halobius]USZ72111.1 phosphonate ABC transporter, permease protein PhnE [Natronosalvus halobius]
MSEGTTGERSSEDARADGGYPGHWERPTVFYNATVKYAIYLAIAAFVLWSLWEIRIGFDRFASGFEAAANLAEGMYPPNFGPRKRELIYEGMVESIAMSIVATFIGVIISIPIAVMAAENLVPRPVYYVGRGILSVSRALHELVLGILAVVAVGIGPLAGVIALVFATPGFYAKLLAEDLEDIDESQRDAIRAVGGSPLQVLLYGVYPQVVPRIAGLAIYRWDINIRASTIIGIVGAGGIGITLINAFDRYEYDFAVAIILVIIAVVLLGEAVSAYTRRRIQ